MKKRLSKCAAVLMALMIPFSLASCKGVTQVEGMLVIHTETSSEGMPSSSASETASSKAAVSSTENVSSETSSKEAAKPEAVKPEAAASASSNETVPEAPSSSEPLDTTSPGTVSSIEEKVTSANVNAKAVAVPEAPESAEAPVSTESPVSKESPAPAETKPSQPQQEEPREALNSDEMKAVWLSFLEFQGFSGSNESTFTSKIESIFDTITAKGLNTVIVQVRPHGDSFYDSEFYPWSKCVSGTMGVGVDYDPVEIMVREAHARGLSIHAWINPYRTMTEKEFSTVDSSYPVKAWYESGDRGSYMVYNQSDSRWWLQPGNPEVQKLIVNGAKEIVRRYDVDGIHLDDYFYCANPSSYGDTVEQAKANTTAMVKGLHDAVKAVNSSIQFGISPAGSFRMGNSLPESDRNYLSTDLALWCSESGYLDYVMPQIYWEHTHSIQPFTETLEKWEELVKASGVKLYVGLAPYKLSAQEIEGQIDEIGMDPAADGYCLFRYDFIHSLDLPR